MESKLSKDQRAILKRIETYWKKNPYLRFGQVLAGLKITRQEQITIAKDIFYDIDVKILERMN